MDTIDAKRCALVLVDYQARLLPSISGGRDAVRQALLLAQAARLLGIRVVGTEQNPQGLGPNLDAIRQLCDVCLTKSHFDACADGLVQALDDLPEPPAQLVVAGCEAHVCLLQTALGLLRAGRRVWVVAAACGSRRSSDHALAMQRLRQAGATLVSSEMVLFEWLAHCRHPQFKPVLQLVKDMPLHPPPV
jgi:nicotinamidase-related amidase